MEKRLEIFVVGKPIAKKRPFFCRRGKGVVAINTQQTEEGRWLLSARGQIREKLSGALQIELQFYFDRPKSHYGSGKKTSVMKATAPDQHTQKPDLDNLVKFTLDCLNGEAWADDAQIVIIAARKRWCNDCDYAGTDIKISEVG
jgi:Holliday junction resolvase RusA-like endonuclease